MLAVMAKNRKKGPSTVALDQYEALELEFSVCQRKLQSKDQALRILRQELEVCQEEKEEHCRLLQHMKDCYFGRGLFSSSVGESEEQALGLPVTMDQLQRQLEQEQQQHQEEIKTLKEKLMQSRGLLSPPSKDLGEEREMLVSQLEGAQAELTSLERQVQTLEDEKEELESERDYFAARCNALTKDAEESERLKPLSSQSTLQELVDENRQLKLEFLEVQAERDGALNKIERYKRAVERRKAREAQNRSLQFITTDKLSGLRQSVKRVHELETLSNSLSEEVKEKSLALAHQKRTNKLLATRIAELEHRLKVLEISGLWSTPNTNTPTSEHWSQHADTTEPVNGSGGEVTPTVPNGDEAEEEEEEDVEHVLGDADLTNPVV